MRIKKAFWLRGSLVLGGVGVTALGFACLPGLLESVHFYSPDSYRAAEVHRSLDFGRAPQREMYHGWNAELQRNGEIYNPSWYPEDLYCNCNEGIWKRLHARNLEIQGDYRGALRYYRASKAPANFLQDRSELFQAVKFRFDPKLAPYLQARYLAEFGSGKEIESAVVKLKAAPSLDVIAPQRDYFLASLDSSRGSSVQAHEYLDVFRQYPKSAKAEPALIMAIRTALQGNHWSGTTQDITFAEENLRVFLTRFPESRFKLDAWGWQARCEWLRGHDLAAIAGYRRLGDPTLPSEVRWKAYDSIVTICRARGRTDGELSWLLRERGLPASPLLNLTSNKSLRDGFERLTTAQVHLFQERIKSDPELLSSYLAFRIEDTYLTPQLERNLLRFATSSLVSIRSAPPDVLERVAQISYNNSEYPSALRLSHRALLASGGSEEESRARYIHAAAQVRLGRPKLAISEYETLLRKPGPDYVLTSAREHLALLCERYGDPLEAMRLYVQLKYDRDIAYLADAKLTPGQLASFIRECPDGPARNVMVYTLGMRYFRRSEFGKALEVFDGMPRSVRLRYGLRPNDYQSVKLDITGFDNLPVDRDPVVSIRKLLRMSSASKQGSSGTRAKALYAMASYMYKQRTLLFYSPGLWRGERANTIDFFWNTQVNDAADIKDLSVHCHEHECLVHVKDLCREIAEKYPHAKVAPDALYTEGLASEHLGNLNDWWREYPWIVDHGIHCFKQLVKLYPRHPLAKPAAKYAGVFAEQAVEERRYR